MIPYLADLQIAEEDSLGLAMQSTVTGPIVLDVAVVRLPHIANFDDFDPLQATPGVRVRYVRAARDLGTPDLIIVPGSKSTIADLLWLRANGLASAIVARAWAGGAVVGICGGFQLLGTVLQDPDGVESERAQVAGLGLLPVTTTFAQQKTTHQVTAQVVADVGLLSGATGLAIRGYEIHLGQTAAGDPPPLQLCERSGVPIAVGDGALGHGGWVWGTYIHGLFHYDALRRRVLTNLAARKGARLEDERARLDRETQYDRLAACLREKLDMPLVYRIIG